MSNPGSVAALSGPLPSPFLFSRANPDPGTRLRVRTRDQNQCWLCGHGCEAVLRIAHHVSASKLESHFREYESMHIISESLTNTAHPDNLIVLCANCHAAYDCDSPYWVMLPSASTLDLYISHEKKDYKLRVLAAARGIRRDRTLPVVDSESVQYQPFIMQESFATGTPLSPSQWPKAYKGDPIAVILKAAGDVGQPCQRKLVTTRIGEQLHMGIPEHLVSKFSELVTLWSREDPAVAAKPRRCLRGQKGQRGDGKGKEKGKEKGKAKCGRVATAGVHKPQQQRGRGKCAEKRPAILHTLRRLHFVSAMPPEQAPGELACTHQQDSTGPFLLGPNCSANDVIQKVLKWRSTSENPTPALGMPGASHEVSSRLAGDIQRMPEDLEGDVARNLDLTKSGSK